MENVIRVDRLVKRYGDKTAVNEISMDVRKGEIFGIVGPNGAGKTTMIEMIEGLRRADGGRITVLGMDIGREAQAIRQRIGVLLQSSSIPGRARVGELLPLFASFYDRTADWMEIAQTFGLADKMKSSYKSLSGGWKQRVSLALSLINDPDIVFLDEPSMGLDPNARTEMWETIIRLRDQGRTIVVTTHYMEEAEALCDRIAVIDRGRLVALDAPSELIKQLGGTKRISFKLDDRINRNELASLSDVVEVEWSGDKVKLHSGNPDTTLQQLFGLAARQGWMVSGLRLEEGSMNEVFGQLTMQGGNSR